MSLSLRKCLVLNIKPQLTESIPGTAVLTLSEELLLLHTILPTEPAVAYQSVVATQPELTVSVTS